MSQSASSFSGVVKELWRYPVKSMLGEQLNSADLTQSGLFGDRAYALRDTEDGKIATAKNPRKWPNLFDYRAVLVGSATAGQKLPPADITLPDGTVISTEHANVSRILSAALKREVRLEQIDGAQYERRSTAEISEEYWLDMEGLDHRDMVTNFNLPQGTFFDTAMVHILTTATLEHLQELYSEGRFAVARFRPNIVIEATDDSKGFVENAWLGRIIQIGESARLKIDLNCARCVMTTLAQYDLPKDPGILRAAAKHNQVNVGVYATVLQGGQIRRGDSISWE